MKNLSLPMSFGLVISAVLVAYFLVLASVDKHTNPALSVVNALITGLGIYEAIRVSKLENLESFTCGSAFKTGLITGSVATFNFTVFFLFYATEVNPIFLSLLLEKLHGGFNADIGMLTFVVAVMGVVTTVVSSLIVMQFFKKSNNLVQNK